MHDCIEHLFHKQVPFRGKNTFMHRTYVGPTSARCRQTPADIPPSSRYRPDVGMFAGVLATFTL